MHTITDEIYLEYGTSTELAMFNASGNSLEKEMMNTLPGIHADSTSCFHGKYMSPCYKMLQSCFTYYLIKGINFGLVVMKIIPFNLKQYQKSRFFRAICYCKE